MDKFCSNCGKELKENADVCLNCGVLIENAENSYKKIKIPGNGMSIAGMVLGIIAIVWTLLNLLSLNSLEPAIVDLLSSYRDLFNKSYVLFWFALGYTFFSLVSSLIGLPLSIVGLVKNKSGKNITGTILNTCAFIISIILFVYIMSF